MFHSWSVVAFKMQYISHILADATDELPIKLIIGVIVLIFWGIGALAKVAKQSAEKQKERLRQVREAIERSQQQARQRAGQPAPPRPVQQPVALAPEIAKRVPKYRPTAAPQYRTTAAPQYRTKAAPQARPQPRRIASPNRPATNYNAMAKPKKSARPAKAPPPLPTPAAKAIVAAQAAEAKVVVQEEASAVASVKFKKPATVGAAAIRRWMRPTTLRQQFILTEVFQAPLGLRENPLY